MSAPTTDLEALIRRLAGRDDRAGRPGDPLDDPRGDVARLLDEVRRRTRALLDAAGGDDPGGGDGGPGPAPPRRGPGRDVGSAPGLGGRRTSWDGWMILAAVLVATSALAAGIASRMTDRMAAGRTEGQARRIVAELREQLAPRPVPPAEPPATAEALGRVESGLLALRDRLDVLGRPAPVASTPPRDEVARPAAAEVPAPGAAAPADPVAPLVADLAAVRREVAAAEAATNRQLQQMRTILEEVNTVVRRVLSRPQPAANANLGPLLAVAIQALISNLQHPSAQVRGDAVEQLLRIGAPARSAVPALQQQHAREVDQNVRTAIETAISVLSSN